MQNFRYLFFAIVMMIILFSRSVSAVIIYQSATYADVTTDGTILGMGETLGSRFHIDQPVQVTAVGGHIRTYTLEGSYFAALVPLEGPGDFPNGKPLDSEEVIASTVFKLNYLQDCHVPLSAYLRPGYYAIVFGTDLLGAQDGYGSMPWRGQTNLPGNLGSMYFDMDNYEWYNLYDPGSTGYFIVEGNPVPEPATILLLGLGALSLLRRKLS